MFWFNLIKMFIIGAIECFLSAMNTKFLQRNKKLPCFIISYANILIWYYVLRIVIDDLTNLYIINLYALGFALGDVLALLFDNYLDKLAKFKGLKLKKKKINRRKK